MKQLIRLLCLFFALDSTLVFAAPVQWTVASGGNGHSYEVVVVPGGIDWNGANAAALAAGGVLASLTSAAEDKFVFDLASTVSAAWQLDSGGNGRGPWLGGVQAPNSNEPAGGWSWSDGSGPFVYTNWAASQPNNSGGIENRLQFFGRQSLVGDAWNDAADIRLHPSYVVEFNQVPLPPALGLMIVGVTSLVGRRRTAVGRHRH